MQYFNNYNEIKKLKPTGFKGHLRKLALDALSVSDKITGADKYLKKPRIQFIYIHHVFRDEEMLLEQLLKKLSSHFTFISYSEAVEKILQGNIDKPYACISSDDGFKNNLKAAEILNRYGVKGCFFINPYIIGERSFDKIKEFCSKRLRFPPVEFMNWDDVEKLQREGHEIGSHTMEHINVAATDTDIFRDDTNLTYNILEKQCGTIKHFAFPYGRYFHFNEAARKIVFDAGFISCASAERGCHVNHDAPLAKDKLLIRRDHVILSWPTDHIFYFLAKNAKNASAQNNLFPY